MPYDAGGAAPYLSWDVSGVADSDVAVGNDIVPNIFVGQELYLRLVRSTTENPQAVVTRLIEDHLAENEKAKKRGAP